MNNRQRMRLSNQKARNWLLENGFDQIWFKPHTQNPDMVFTQKGNYRAIDLWNLFDGIAIDSDKRIHFLQMKTNAWAPPVPIIDFLEKCKQVTVIVLNITNKRKECKGKYKVFVRRYAS